MKDVLNCTPSLDYRNWFSQKDISFSFVAASRKKSFHISMKSHSVEAKLCSLYQFLKRFMVFQVSHYFAHLSCSIILQ